MPKASAEITSQACMELAELQRNDDWEAAVQLVVKAGDPKVQHIAVNDWYRLRRSLEIIKASLQFIKLCINIKYLYVLGWILTFTERLDKTLNVYILISFLACLSLFHLQHMGAIL